MNRINRCFLILAVVVTAPFAFAHDPAEHAREAAAKNAAPDCAAMKHMDHSKMGPDDPVMRAMLLKCGDAQVGMDHGKAGGTPAESDAHGGH